MIVALALLLTLGQDPAISSASSPCRVLLTHDRADPSWYQEIGTIQFTKRRNASSGAARKELAKRAHKLGADAVINVSLESKRTVWSFPHSIMDASGKAVKWTPIGLEKSYELNGSCFSVKGKEEPRPARVAKDKKEFPWGAVIAGAVVGAAVLTATQTSGTTYYAPVETPTAPVVTNNAALWIDTVSTDGSVIVLSDGSVWSVDVIDQVRTSLWLPVQRVAIASGRYYGQFTMVRQGVRTETATVTRVR